VKELVMKLRVVGDGFNDGVGEGISDEFLHQLHH
jgi:hypothetical protein